MRATLHTDGGARGNPGPAGIGVVLRDESGDVIAEIAESIGSTTNNVAEYTALIKGLELAIEKRVTDIEVFMDSKLVVHQVRGEWKIKNAGLKPLAIKANHLANRFSSASITYVPREQNSDADKLANQAMDAAADLYDGDGPEPGQGSLLE